MANRTGPAAFIKSLDMNGLSGRMAYLPAPPGKTAEILFVYGQHSSIERWWGLLKYVNRYGAVTAPDLPGFGGMQSFYKIGAKPTLDNYADYLAAFVKLRYRRKKIVIVGMSFGFVVATRMLQRCPELSSKVSLMVSLAGLTHHDDFVFSKHLYRLFLALGRACSWWLPARLYRLVLLNSFVLRHTYDHTFQAKHKFAAARTPDEYKMFMDMEVKLWQANDPRTHAYTLVELLRLDNCTKRLSVPLWHVSVDADQYLDRHRVEQHMRVTFEKVHVATAHLQQHAPSVIADEATAASLIPSQLRRVLSRL